MIDLALFEAMQRTTEADPEQRIGQVIVNSLHRVAPELSAKLPEEVDPFYDDSLIPKFWDWFYAETEGEEAK